MNAKIAKIYIYFCFGKLPLFVRILLFYFFLICFYFLLYSKTKKRQWILFIWSGTMKEKRKEKTNECLEEITRHHGIIWWWLCVNSFSFFNFFLNKWQTLLLYMKHNVQKYPYSLEWVISGLLLLLAPVGSGFWQYFLENSLVDHEKRTFFFPTKSKGFFMWSISLGTLDVWLFVFA